MTIANAAFYVVPAETNVSRETFLHELELLSGPNHEMPLDYDVAAYRWAGTIYGSYVYFERKGEPSETAYIPILCDELLDFRREMNGDVTAIGYVNTFLNAGLLLDDIVIIVEDRYSRVITY